QSPDLNPIEKVWLVLKQNIQDLYQPKSVTKMQQAIQQAWEDFPTSILDHLVNSVPNTMVVSLPENLLQLPPVDMQANPILLPPLLQS
ncbi:hypothetical protein PCANC_28344, partial [Puccinia coronata f. sp. avenae]